MRVIASAQQIAGRWRVLAPILAVVAVAAIGLAWVQFQPALRAGPEPSGRIALSEEHRGEGWRARSAADLADRRVEVALFWGEPGGVHVFDRTTGARVAEIELGHNPLAVYRAAEEQLLVSDAVTGSADRKRLLVFDLADQLALEHEIALPARANYTASMPPWFVLSADERYLYYTTHEIRDGIEECRGGGDAAVCDRDGVAVLDLEAPDAGVATYELPQGCGAPHLSAADTGVLATCVMSGVVQAISPNGPVGPRIDAGGLRGLETETAIQRRDVRPMFAQATDDGVVVLYADGSYILFDDGEASDEGRFLPEGRRLSYVSPPAVLESGVLLLPYQDEYHDTEAAGFVVFDAEAREIEQDTSVTHQGVHASRGGVLLVRNEQLYLLDEGEVVRAFAVDGRWDVAVVP